MSDKVDLIKNLDQIKLSLISKMQQKNYSVLNQQDLINYCEDNLAKCNNEKEMDIYGVRFLELFYFNRELTALFETYRNTAKKINEHLVHQKYSASLGELKALVDEKKSKENLPAAHLLILKAMEDLYECIENESKKGPEFQARMIEVITSMKDMVELKKTNIRDYIRCVPGNINYVFLPLIPPLASLHITLPLMIVSGLNPALAIGIVGICILSLIAAAILTSICLFFSSHRTGFSEKLVNLCELFDDARYQDLKMHVNLKIESTNLDEDEKKSIQQIQDLIESHTQSNTTRYAMLNDLYNILHASKNSVITLTAFKAHSPTWHIAYPSISYKTYTFFNQSYEKKSALVQEDLHNLAASCS